jgi:HlyD family secretion protein
MMAGTEVIRLANLNEMEVNVDVSETDIIRVQVGDTAKVEIDAYLNRMFTGVVTEIANSANTTAGMSTDQVTNFTVKVRVLRDSYKDLIPADKPAYSPFRPGMSATVEIQTNKVDRVLAVPIQAVTTRDSTVRRSSKAVEPGFGNEEVSQEEPREEEPASKQLSTEVSECVFVVSDGKVEMRTVKTGIQDNMNIQVLDGLKQGEEVIVAPFNAISRLLHSGDQVHVVPREELFTREED